VIERTRGVAVDGTVYRDAEFIARIERYHDDMLDAHRQGMNDLQIPIPVPALMISSLEAPAIAAAAGAAEEAAPSPVDLVDGPGV
jgi:predicted alpha/beta hydrolase